MNVSRPLKFALAIYGICSALCSQAAPTIFSACPGDFYLSLGSKDSIELFEGSPDVGGTVNFTLQSPAPTLQYNAIGFHEANKFIYGLEASNSSGVNTGDPARLIRIGQNGEVARLGPIPGLIDKNYSAGDMDPAGNYYVKGTEKTEIIKISGIGPVGNETAAITTSIITVGAGLPGDNFLGGDIAWVGDAATGSLYTIKESGGTNTLYKINPVDGGLTTIGSFINNAAFGALWGTPDALYANDNNGSGFFQFDLLTGVGVKIANSIGASSNDGARCVSNRPLFPADLSISETNNQTLYTPGQTTQYTITATNNGPLGVLGATVVDDLPSGITTATWTCSSAIGSCTDASGSGAINTMVDLPNGASATFVLDMDIPASFTGQLVNTATIAVAKLGNGSPKTTDDSDLSNNTASDTDTSVSMPMITAIHQVPTLPWYSMMIILFGLLGISRCSFGSETS